MSEDKNRVGNSYIINLYEEVEHLNHYYSLYINELTLETATNNEELKDEVSNKFIEYSNHIRYYATKIITRWRPLKEKIKSDVDIEETYKNLMKNRIPETDNLEKFMTQVNNILLEDVIKNILENNQELVDKLLRDGRD